MAAQAAALAAGGWLAWRRMPEALPALATAGIAAAFGVSLAALLAWRLLDERVARPAGRLAAALRVRAHGGAGEGEVGRVAGEGLGDLGPAAAALCDRLATLETAFDARLTEATRAAEAEGAQLAALLSEIPVAIMLVDAEGAVMLYDRQCVHALGQVSTLGLGRPVSDYLDRDALEAAREAESGGDGPATVTLPLADGSGSVRARVRPALQGRGFMLAMEVEDAAMAERPLVFDFAFAEARPARDLALTPLSELTCVAFDTETTGLDTARDAIVQIGAVRLLGGRILPGERFETLVDPGRPIPPASSRIHGIDDAAVGGAPDAATALAGFHGFARGAVLVAHNAPFDLAFLKRQAPEGLAFDHPVLDTVLLSAAVFGETETHTLDAIADRLGVRIDGAARHTATGDAVATAEVLLRLIPILEARGVGSFGEAVAAMRRYARLLPDLNG